MPLRTNLLLSKVIVGKHTERAVINYVHTFELTFILAPPLLDTHLLHGYLEVIESHLVESQLEEHARKIRD